MCLIILYIIGGEAAVVCLYCAEGHGLGFCLFGFPDLKQGKLFAIRTLSKKIVGLGVEPNWQLAGAFILYPD